MCTIMYPVYTKITNVFVDLCQALKKIRHSGLKPYIIFIASPRMERLQITRRVSSHKAKRKSSSSGAHMDDMQVYTVSTTAC